MAYEIEAASIAVDAFIRNVCDQLDFSDEQHHMIEDACVTLPSQIAACDRQSTANELIFTTIGEATDYNAKIQNTMAGAIDFFWQVYNDTAEVDLEV